MSRISSAARSPSSVLVGGIRMSTTATSGRWRADLAQELLRVAGLGHHLEPVLLVEQAHDALAQQHRVVRHHHAQEAVA